MSSPPLRRLASWIALLALLAVTFMPTLTSAFSDIVPGSLCSADASRNPAPADSHPTLDHCPYCALHADLTLPLQPVAEGSAATVLFRELPPAFLAAPRASSTWSTAQSRAPPAFA